MSFSVKSPRTKRLFGAALAAILTISAVPALANGVNIYSYRQPFLIQPMLDAFTKETGIRTFVVYANQGMIERVKQEGRNSPVDIILTVDIGRIQDAVDADVVQPVQSEVLESRIPAQYRDSQDRWFGMTTRARVIYASKERVENAKDLTYEDLADPKFKDRLCTRSGKHVYQIALVASMIEHHGREEAKKWLQGVKDNLARKPQGNDRQQVKAIKEGLCDVSLGNHYYYAAMMADEEQRPWAESVNVVFPNQNGRGTHVNISGVALAKYAPNRENAVKLIEFLASDEAQHMYADLNGEYPVVDGVSWSPILDDLGRFESDDLSLDRIAELRGEALRLTDEVRYDD